ncbi:DNA mismatch repair protein [bacterium]|nr:DNA mismatch repair protein [bacterium]
MAEISLLNPKNSKAVFKNLTNETINDLSLEYICDALSEDEYERNVILKIMSQITCDEETVRYRCDVFEDFLKFPKLREALTELLKKLADLRDLERFQKDTEASSLWKLINRLREIDGYVKCITEIKECLENTEIKSQGLLSLKKQVQDIYVNSGFPQLKKDLEETFEKAQKMKSVTIGVNLDDLLRPKNAGILSLNDKAFSSSGLMQHFVKFVNTKDELHHGTDISDIKKFHPSSPKFKESDIGFGEVETAAGFTAVAAESATGGDPLSDSLKKAVTDIMKKTVRDIQSVLQKYVNISGYSLVSIMPEIVFYIRWAELVEKIQSKGIKMCKAEVLPSEENRFSARGIYNLKLAIKRVRGEDFEIVGNDIDFDEEKGRVFILTGPNRGGKTTFTQAVGFAFLLAQNGIYVPASVCRISPCDNIFTHFPADENDTVDLGRLGEESKRLWDIFDVATDKSLLLLNESLATTNVSEGLFIARDVVKAMCYLGVRAVFNTHMHDLARNLDRLNNDKQNKSKAESLVTGVENGERSFKVFVSPPQGSSYARDIAKKYGVTFEQIKKNIDSK